MDGVPETFSDGVAFDTGSNRAVVADGITAASWDPQTGIWDARAARGPHRILGAPAAYDAQSDRIILFGGLDLDSMTVSDQTWAYDLDGNTWTEMNPAARPEAGNFHVIAYDAQSDRVILFGGGDLADRPIPHTWAYDYETDAWTRMSPPASPSARYYTAMVYDAAGDRMILFGGTDRWASATFNDTWAYDYDADTWTQIDASGPTVRGWHGMAYDDESRSVVLFGGGRNRVDVTDETWIFDVTTKTWRLHAPLTLGDEWCTYGGPTQLRAGELTIQFSNGSQGLGAADLLAFTASASFGDLMAHVEAEKERFEAGLEPMGPPDYTMVVRHVEVAAGDTRDLVADVEPGTYAVVCGDADPDDPGIYLFGPVIVFE